MDSLDPFRLNATTPPAPEAAPEDGAVEPPPRPNPLARAARRVAPWGAAAGAGLALVRFDWARYRYWDESLLVKDVLQQTLLWAGVCGFAAWIAGGVVAWAVRGAAEPDPDENGAEAPTPEDRSGG
ncbi:MAG: hypothetical protein ACOCX4_01105 [Planctomycetota bacterium]